MPLSPQERALADRIETFKRAFPNWPASWPLLVREKDRGVLYGLWLIGATWGNESDFYGSYPRGYLKRIMALFPTEPKTILDRGLEARDILHVFSGSLKPGPYVRLDINAELEPDIVGSVYDASKLFFGKRPFRLVIADPPYSAVDAEHYNAPMVDRGKAIRALAQVTKPGGHLVWLDVCWPLHSKTQWRTVGRITVIRSTNHRVRMCTIFERAA
jgi:hypothetical protein